MADKTLGLSERELMEATEAEAQMQLQDRLIQETAEVRIIYVYSRRTLSRCAASQSRQAHIYIYTYIHVSIYLYTYICIYICICMCV